MNNIIALVGMTGSGKSTASDYIINKGYQFLRFGQITLDIIKDKGLKPTEENEKVIREDMRKQHGPAAYAILNMPKIDYLLKTGNVVADGLYSWSEYKVLKNKYQKNIAVIAVYSPPALRYERLANRKLKDNDKDLRNRPATIEQAQSRDYAEIENIEKGGPIAMADFTLLNTESLDDLYKQIDNIMNKIKS